MTIIIVGDFLTQGDEEEGGPFKSKVNRMLRAQMRQVGIDPAQCFFTNVIGHPPEGRQSIFSFCGPKESSIPHLKFVKKSAYLDKKYFSQVERLWKLINEKKPNLIIACGELALWALTSEPSMIKARGRIHPGNSAIAQFKVLPIFSPQHVIGNYPDRMIVLSDLHKAKREAEFPEIRRPRRFLHLYPTLEDMENFFNEYIAPCKTLAVDIETKGLMITCVGFAPSPERAIVVPFFDEMKEDGNYWPTKREEAFAWAWVRRVLACGKEVGGQNYQYDMQYLWRQMGIKNPCFTDDTMLMHHALYPEMRKGLGFLASLYTDELPWKFMAKNRSSDKTGKKDDEE